MQAQSTAHHAGARMHKCELVYNKTTCPHAQMPETTGRRLIEATIPVTTAPRDNKPIDMFVHDGPDRRAVHYLLIRFQIVYQMKSTSSFMS
jgi:hypothetical protein